MLFYNEFCNIFLLFVIIVLEVLNVLGARSALFLPNGDVLPHVRLAKDLMDKRRYDKRVRPTANHSQPTKVSFSMSLYQILAVNEKQQNIDLNLWVIQKWNDDFLGWNPFKYGMINITILPYESIWLPDTYVYNSVVMNREETERYINAVVETQFWEGKRGSKIKLMYPSLYRTSCLLDIRFFPYDQQNCTLIISSWTNDKAGMDYEPDPENLGNIVNLDNFIFNEEWDVVSFRIYRVEQTFKCCPHPWVLLHASLVIRRKPLYYIVNLVIPTSVITLVAVTGFFTPASTSNERREKLSLGIDSLLAMSILMMMVSEQMPTTSDYVPLFGLFYLAIIFIIFIGTLFTALILNIHLQKAHHKAVPPLIGFLFFHKIAPWLSIQPPTTLLELWLDTGVTIKGINKLKGDKKRKAIYQSMRRANNDDKVKEKILKEIEKNNKNHRLLTSDPIPTFNHINPPELSYSHSLTSNMSARAPAQPYQLSFPPSHRGSVISNLYPPAAPLSPLTLDVGGVGLIRRNTPTRAARARQNWQRLAQKAYRTAKEERARRLQEIPYVDAPPPSTFTTMPIRLQMLCLQNSPLFKNSPGPTSAEASAMHLKLKRRYGQEWEYLATVLDRLLLIVFSFLVILVTGAVILIGEGIHFSYKMQEDK